MSPADIAVALDITEIELRARCERELTNGKTIVRAQLIASLSEAATKGNVAAGKVLLALLNGDSAVLEAPPSANPPLTERALRLVGTNRP